MFDWCGGGAALADLCSVSLHTGNVAAAVVICVRGRAILCSALTRQTIPVFFAQSCGNSRHVEPGSSRRRAGVGGGRQR